MTEPHIRLRMLVMRRDANSARYRITRWKMTEQQANRLVDEMWGIWPIDIDDLKRGTVYIFGAQIVVTP